MKSDSEILRRAREVLSIEAQAVKDQTGHLDAGFVLAVKKIHNVTGSGGQVVVMGIGKSGLVGRKIAATLSSVGTPAVFVHPSESLHGDLGMIRAQDAVLLLSASGETEEIRKILPVLKEKDLTLIAMTGEKRSRLARASDHLILSAVKKEACPYNLAPTASTTAMLALGDALAMALMDMKGFKPSDFARLHPGGNLGKKLSMTIRDVMRKGKQNPVVGIGASIQEALLEMSRTRLGATCVVDASGRLAGFFTDGDLRRKLQKDPALLKKPIASVMTRNPCTLHPDQTLNEALILFKERGFDNIPVVDGKGRPAGVLDERDLLAEGVV